MTAKDYQKWTAPLRRHPLFTDILLLLNKFLTILIYIAYPVLLIYLIMRHDSRFLHVLLTPLISFLLLSIFRDWLNAPRPYEVLDIQPLIHKNTKGHSFPSRHVFSIAVIACAYGYIIAWAGIIGILLAIFMAYIRVLGGVHFPRDVIAGLLIGIMAGIIGFIIV